MSQKWDHPRHRPRRSHRALAAVIAAVALAALPAPAPAGVAGESGASTQVLGGDSMLGFVPGPGAERDGSANRSYGDLGAGTTRGQGFLRDARGFTKINVPGASVTSVTGSNGRGQIVGAYAESTEVARINDRRQIVGIYTESGDDSSGDVRGFLLERDRFTRIDVPGSASTFPTDIDNSGRIVGRYVDSGGAIHGFMRDRGGDFTDIDVPDAAATAVVAVNDRGQTVGYYADAGGTLRGFRRDEDGTVTTIDPPDTRSNGRPTIALGPLPYGINNRGQIVGVYRDSEFQIYGFKLDRGRFAAIKIPGARGESFATDIDDRGGIIGIDR